MTNKRWWWPYGGALVGAAIAAAFAWSLAGDDVNKRGDWRAGAARFIGMVTVIGGAVGYVGVRQLAGRAPVTRDGFTLSYGRIEPRAAGYRELETLTVGDLAAALTSYGYEPELAECDDAGEPAGTIDARTPLAGANLAVRDRGVRGWVRVQLAPTLEGQARGLGVIEMWSRRGESTEELALFVLRALDGMLAGLNAKRESSMLGEDPAALVVAGLGERPVHRAL